jgi:hypothetical protein
MSQQWYHGTPNDFEAFDNAWLGKGTDQLGSGFYFAERIETARGYALTSKEGANVESGFLLTAELDIKKPLPEYAPISRKQIETIMRLSPDFEEAIWNYGDIGYYGEARIVKEAVDAFAALNSDPDDNTLKMLFCLSNDFYRDYPAEFLAAVTKVTGYDGLYRDSGNGMHAVVWDAGQIEIVDRKEVIAERDLAM